MKQFPIDKFKIMYPMFKDVNDDLIGYVADDALCYMNGCGGDCFEQLWLLLVAHMLHLRKQSETGSSQSGAIVSAAIDKVSVSFAAPPSGSDAKHWFNLSPFGQQYLVLQKRCGSPVFYVGGLPERSAFRSVGGRFPNRGRVR